MKIRQGFVSNSSSSSFVVIGNENFCNTPNPEELSWNKFSLGYNDEILIPNTFGGETEFGWGPYSTGEYSDFATRLNFAALQCKYSENPEYSKMLSNVIKNKFGIDYINLFTENEGYEVNHDGYIDHQSSAVYGANLEIFDSEETLENFIFSKDSYIVLDNDNYDRFKD